MRVQPGPREYEDWIREHWGDNEQARELTKEVIPYEFWVWYQSTYPGGAGSHEEFDRWREAQRVIEHN